MHENFAGNIFLLQSVKPDKPITQNFTYIHETRTNKGK